MRLRSPHRARRAGVRLGFPALPCHTPQPVWLPWRHSKRLGTQSSNDARLLWLASASPLCSSWKCRSSCSLGKVARTEIVARRVNSAPSAPSLRVKRPLSCQPQARPPSTTAAPSALGRLHDPHSPNLLPAAPQRPSRISRCGHAQ
jgi:hypothetical protein